MKKVYNQQYWCFLRSSPKLRAAIKFRMEQMGIRSQDVAKGAGINNTRLSSYLNGMHKPLTQYQLIQLCKFLGLEVDLQVTIKDETYPLPDFVVETYVNSHPT